jgi:hypothetical protein
MAFDRISPHVIPFRQIGNSKPGAEESATDMEGPKCDARVVRDAGDCGDLPRVAQHAGDHGNHIQFAV